MCEIQNYTILAVDDNDLNLSVMEKILLYAGYNTFTALNASEAKEIAEREHLDLIILDIMLPNENGFDLLEYFKKQSKTASIPVIFITALTEIDLKVKGFDMGAVDYITKPYHPAEIKARIKTHLQLHTAQEERLKIQADKLRQIETIQDDMLIQPDQLPEAAFACFYESLHEAGGDFYDVIRLAEHTFGYFIGDVSGHDIKTSYISMALKALLKQNCATIYDPLESMMMVNHVLIDILPSDKFLTAAYLSVNRLINQVEIINMGHLPIIYCQPEKTTLISLESDLLGAYPDPIFCRQLVQAKKGDRFYMMSDGLVEDAAKKDLWPVKLKTMLPLFKEQQNVPLQTAIATIREQLIPTIEKARDDIVLLAIEV